MEDNNKKKNRQLYRIEKAEQDLFNAHKETDFVDRHNVDLTKKQVKTAWETNTETMSVKNKKPKHLLQSKKFRGVLFVAALFFITSLIFSFTTFFRGTSTVSNANIDILVLGNAFVDGGEELPLQIRVANRNRVNLDIADLLIEYSRGTGGTSDIVRERISLGKVSSGSIVDDIVSIIVFGEQGTVRDVLFSLEYRVPGSNAIFVKELNYPVTIASSPVELSVQAPNQIISNQPFSIEVSLNQNSTDSLQNAMVTANYPAGFMFESASPAPSYGNDAWLLGDLAPGAERTITIQGRVTASPGERRVFTFATGTQSRSNERRLGVQFSSVPLDVQIGSSFVTAGIQYGNNSSGDFVIPDGTSSNFTVMWENQMQNALNNLEVELELSGNGFDPNRVTVSNGFFDPSTNTVRWNGTSMQALQTVGARQRGELSFSLVPRSGVVNPVIDFTLNASALPVGQSNQRIDIQGIYSTTARVQSQVQLTALLTHFSGAFNNSGNMPPLVGQETTYTLSLNVVGSSNNLQNTRVTAKLPSYVVWKNQVSPNSETVTFNSVTREITWNIGNLVAGNSNQRTANVQIGFIPTSAHLGAHQTLVTDIEFIGTDMFTGSEIVRRINQVTSSLNNDSGFTGNSGGSVVSQ
jgi:hypothetical protein